MDYLCRAKPRVSLTDKIAIKTLAIEPQACVLDMYEQQSDDLPQGIAFGEL